MTTLSLTIDRPASADSKPTAPLAPGPKRLDTPLGTFAMLRMLRDNPVATWMTVHFEKPVVSGNGVLGRLMIVSDPALIRHVLVDKAANYPKDDLQRRILAPGLGKGLLIADGEMWRSQRRALAPLFSPRVVHGFESAMADAAHDLVMRWDRQRDGRTVDVSAEMAKVTLRVLGRTIFSDGLTRTTEDFATMVSAYLDAIGRLDPLDVLGAPSFIPRVGRIRARPALRFFDAAVDAMIARRRAVIEADPAGAPRDLLTLLLEAADPETGVGLDEVEVKANIVTFIAAGHETTSNTLTWALYLLSQAPEVLERVEREVDALLPHGRLEAGVLDQLVETRAVIDEALRLYPPAATISRQAHDPDRIGEHPIKAKTQIVISPWVLHRHETLWDQPNRFSPERFLPGAPRRIDRFAYLPFGAGPRICIGASFALQEAVTVLATVLRAYRLELRPGHVVMPVQRISLRPKGGMPMSLHRRG